MNLPPSLPHSPLASLRARIRRLEQAARPDRGVLPLGVAAIDAHLPWGGLPLGALHEIAGSGADTAAATLFAASLLARLSGPVLWCHGGNDLFPPGLAGAGLSPDRVIHVVAGEEKAALLAMEEGLRQRGLAGVVGEIFHLPMVASRRLALAAETSGALALALRRREEKKPGAIAAATRWRISPVPRPRSAVPSLGRALWRLELFRCRGAEVSAWLVEAPDAAGRLDLAAVLPDRSAAPLEQNRARA